MRTVAGVVSALLLGASLMRVSAQPRPPVEGKDVELAVTQVGPNALPYQPLRIRMQLARS